MAEFDLKTICNALASIGSKWYKVGIQLGLSPSILLEFKKEDDPLSAFVDHCLRGNVAEPLTWQSIITALRSEHVGEPGLAQQICKKYCKEGASLKSADTIKSDFYCQQCHGQQLVIQSQQGTPILICHSCHQVTPISASKVGFQSAFQISGILESLEKPPLNAPRSTASQNEGTLFCLNHPERELYLYCDTCNERICLMCIGKNEKHHNHRYEDLIGAFEKYKNEIMSSLEPVEGKLSMIQMALVRLDARCYEILDQQVAAESDIQYAFLRLHTILDIRKTELISQVHQLTQSKLKRLAAQRDQLETTQAQLKSRLHFVRKRLKTDNLGEALLMKSTTMRQVKELISIFQPDALEPSTEANVAFSTSADIAAECQNFGKVSSSSIDPSKCYATGKSMKTATVGKQYTVFLHALNSKCLPCKMEKEHVICELISDLTGARIGCSVEEKGQNQYEISFLPTIKGNHHLHMKVEGQYIRQSPFSVAVVSPGVQLSTPILTVAEVRAPTALAITKDGEMVVAEGSGHCVTILSPRGERLLSFGTFPGPNCLNPCGVAVDDKGNVFIADRVTYCVQKFTVQGKLLGQAAIVDSIDSVYSIGIAFNACNGKVYATTPHLVHILNSDLNTFSTFDHEGTLGHLTCDSTTGNIYVGSYHSIHVYTAGGIFKREIGKGYLDSHDITPCGVAIDSSGRVYVSGSRNSCICIFNSDGDFLRSFGKQHLSVPLGLVVDSNGVLYVCDETNGIIVF